MHQSDVINFLSKPQTFGLDENTLVKRCDTHISIVFLAGEYAYKLKRAIKLPFVDFRQLEDRQIFCQRELDVNALGAPGLYLDLVAVTLGKQGLALGGEGEVVDWLVKMHRFDQTQLFDQLCEAGKIDASLMERLSDHIVACYNAAPVDQEFGGYAGMKRAFDGHYLAFENCPQGVLDQEKLTKLKERVDGELKDRKNLLEERSKKGYVRACHGDLHLRNICWFQDEIMLFDAIEFEPDFSVIDVLYDLSFLLMDLCHRGRQDLANVVLNRYAGLSGDVAGASVLGLFLCSRAAIRTHVDAVASQNQATQELAQQVAQGARQYLDETLSYLADKPVCIVAIGGLSGCGKSHLAKALAPYLGRKPGAYIARTDMIRKRLMQVKPSEKLGPYGYREPVTKLTYETLYSEVSQAAQAGYCVVVDGVFAREEEREKLQALAASLNIPFIGLWLEAPIDVLEERVRARVGDPSDANEEIVRLQAGYNLGEISWHHLNAARDFDAIFSQSCLILDAYLEIENK